MNSYRFYSKARKADVYTYMGSASVATVRSFTDWTTVRDTARALSCKKYVLVANDEFAIEIKL